MSTSSQISLSSIHLPIADAFKMRNQTMKLKTNKICHIALKSKLFLLSTLIMLLMICHSSKANDDTLYLYEDDLSYDSNYYYDNDYNSALTKYYKESGNTVGHHNSEFVPTVIPLLESRNLDVGQRRSKSFQQNSNNQNAANQFVNQLFNHQQLSSNNVPSILSNSNNAFNSQPYPAIERASSINHHVAINAQDHAREQVQQNVKLGPNRHKLINRRPTPLQRILQDVNRNTANNKIVPEPGWIPVTKLSLPKVPLGAAGRPIPQTLQQAQIKLPPQDIVHQVILRNKLQQQTRLEALLKKTKLPSIKFPPISQITGPTPVQPASTISQAFKKNHARFNVNNQQYVQHQAPTPESYRPVVIVTTIRPSVIKQHTFPITSSSSPSPLIQIVESRSVRPPILSSHQENSVFPLHLNSRKPHVLTENSVPITVYPNDTVLIQYHTTLERLNTDTKGKPTKNISKGKRRERATFNHGFEERIKDLSCGDEAEDLIRDILESPLRKRNALLGILRMKKKEREGRESQPSQQSGGRDKQNNFSNFPQSSVGTNLNAFTTQQQTPKRPQNKRKQNNQANKNKQTTFQNNNIGQQKFTTTSINKNTFQNQGRFNNFPEEGSNRNANKIQALKGNSAGSFNSQKTPNNRNNDNQQGNFFGGKNSANQLKQTTSASFSTIQTTTIKRTTKPPTTFRTTRRPKNIPINNQPQRVPQEPQQRATSSVKTVPAKITVNEQFQHFAGFRQASAKKKNQQKQPKSSIDQVLRGSFEPPSLAKSNFEQAFLTKIPAKQIQNNENQEQKKQTQLERARKRLQQQQRKQKKLKQQSNIVGINGKPVNVQQQNTNGGKKTILNNLEPPKFFIDVPKKPLKGVILQQVQTQQNKIPRKEKSNKKKHIFLPGEFTEVQPAPKSKPSNQQNRGNNNLNNKNQFIQQQPGFVFSTTETPKRNKQARNGNNNRNKSPRQNFSSDANKFSNNNVNRNRQPKTVNNAGKQTAENSQKANQIFTTSRPRVTQTFVPRQILSGNNNKKTEKKSGEQSGSTFTIEQFLKRYPEVKRLSSRFGDGKNRQNRVVGNKNDKNNQNGRKKNERKENKRKEGRKAKNQGTNNSHRDNNTQNKFNQQISKQNEERKQKSVNRRPQSQLKNKKIPAATPSPIATTIKTRRPVVTTRRPILTTTFAPVTPVPKNAPKEQKQSRHQQPRNQQNKNKKNKPIENSVPDDVDFPTDQELSSVDYSYLYYQDYYDELVPVHHRFKQLATTTSTTPKPKSRRPKNQRKKKNKNKNNGNKKNKGNRNGKRIQGGGGNNKNNKRPQSNSFSFFSLQPADGSKKNGGNQGNFPNFPSSNEGNNPNPIKKQKSKFVTTRIPVTQAPPPKPLLKPSKVGEPKQKPIAIKSNDPLQAGPYGYVDKGSFFSDSHVKGFPDMIEVVYQGFVWALNLYYPDKQKEKHGGVHTILKDKVKRKKVFFKDGDYIVRVSGRASPYNINRLTFYTAKGEKYGPWGDRRSADSIDFDVSAPPGHGLAYFSGTVDFGVPFRSISFHWKPHE